MRFMPMRQDRWQVKAGAMMYPEPVRVMAGVIIGPEPKASRPRAGAIMYPELRGDQLGARVPPQPPRVLEEAVVC